MKKENFGQPTNLSQLKKALTVGTFFEIYRFGNGPEKRCVIKASATYIVSIVPYDDENRINKCGGSYMHFSKAAYWSFENGFSSVYHSVASHDEANKIFSVRILPYDEEEEQRFQEWSKVSQSKIEQANIEKEQQIKEEAEKKNDEAYESIVSPVLKVLIDGGEIEVNKTVVTYNSDGTSKERNVILFIADLYGVEIPLKLQGWIKKALAKIKYNKQENSISLWRFKDCGVSKTIYDYLFKIIHSVNDVEAFFN